MSVVVAMRYLAMLLLSACGACGGVPTRSDLPRDLPVPTVLRLSVHRFDRPGGYCSAFKVGEDLVATAGHCCEPDALYEVGDDGTEATVLVDDDTSDVCVMRAEVPGDRIPLAAHDPAMGEAVYTYGFPYRQPVISTGYWSGRDAEGQGICSVVVAGGASGSPVLNLEGEAVGVLVAGYRPGDSIAFVSTVEHLRLAVRRALRAR